MKLKESNEPEDRPPRVLRSRDAITSRAGTIQMLAELLTHWLGRPVENRTGLTGRYDFKLQYAPETAADPEAGIGPSGFTALQEQLGLKLEAGKGTLRNIVIDRAERPTN